MSGVTVSNDGVSPLLMFLTIIQTLQSPSAKVASW